MNSLVSIIIATFESNLSHLSEAIDSALLQTYTNLEIIISDDSSSDDVKNHVSSLSDPRIRYFRNNPPLGAANNHWISFQKARGSFISILNHDDCLDRCFLADLVAPLCLYPDAILAFCDHWIMDSMGQIQHKSSDDASLLYGRSHLAAGLHKPFQHLVVGQTIPMAMGTLFRRSALPDCLPSNAGPAYDLWLSYLLARSLGGAIYVPTRLSFWRNHDQNTTSGGGVQWLYDSALCWETIANDSVFAVHRSFSLQKASQRYVACSVRCWKDNNIYESLSYASKSITIKPSARAFLLILFNAYSFLIFRLMNLGIHFKPKA